MEFTKYSKACRFSFEKGGCKNRNCSFAHNSGQIVAQNCNFDQECRNDNCEFYHTKKEKNIVSFENRDVWLRACEKIGKIIQYIPYGVTETKKVSVSSSKNVEITENATKKRPTLTFISTATVKPIKSVKPMRTNADRMLAVKSEWGSSESEDDEEEMEEMQISDNEYLEEDMEVEKKPEEKTDKKKIAKPMLPVRGWKIPPTVSPQTVSVPIEVKKNPVIPVIPIEVKPKSQKLVCNFSIDQDNLEHLLIFVKKYHCEIKISPQN